MIESRSDDDVYYYSDQLGKVLVCVHAVTIQHRGRATRSINHDTHGHRLGQDKAQAGFESSQEAREKRERGIRFG